MECLRDTFFLTRHSNACFFAGEKNATWELVKLAVVIKLMASKAFDKEKYVRLAWPCGQKLGQGTQINFLLKSHMNRASRTSIKRVIVAVSNFNSSSDVIQQHCLV